MHRTLFALLIAFAVLAAACGDDDGATTTTSGATTTTADAGGEPTTTAAETTTTAAAETTTTTASDGATETTSAPPTDGSAAAVKANAAAEAVPNGWTVVIKDEMTEPPADDILFEACLEEGSFDLDNLNAVSESAGGATPVPSNGSIEARIFQSEALAAEAYTVLETILGTTIGRECIASASLEAIGAELPAGASVDYRVGEVLIPTGDFGVSIEYAITIEGQTLVAFIDLVAYRDGACTLYGAFTGFQEPFPALVAEAMFQAAIDAI